MKKLAIFCIIIPLCETNISFGETTAAPQAIITSLPEINDIFIQAKNNKTLNPIVLYDLLASAQKKVTNKNSLEIFYALRSFFRVQPETLSMKDTLAQATNIKDSLIALQQNFPNGKDNQITHIQRLLKKDIFIHLSYEQMQQTIKKAEELNTNIYQDSLNETELFNPVHFGAQEIQEAKEILHEIDKLKQKSIDFSKDIDKLSKEQLSKRIQEANNFKNQLKNIKFTIGKIQLPISRNIRKYILNILSIHLDKLIKAHFTPSN